MNMTSLLEKYDVQVPRYTSYPTVPSWSRTPTAEEWLQDISESLKERQRTLSLYLHVPFCETLCTFCGCNNIITRDHKQENSYVGYLLKELALYQSALPEMQKRELKHIHLGGGTPTFLSADHLKALLEPLLGSFVIPNQDFEGSIEVDPRRTNDDQLRVLRDLGFNRVSLGVQDFNERVQKLVNRLQSFEVTARITEKSRELGYTSVNFDLIYGLPGQTLDLMKHTVESTLKLRPDRIALYSFALVPWIKPAQRIFKDSDLPLAPAKRELYEYARQQLLAEGYIEIGMDHFALPTDALAKASHSGTLHRNFMGYTDQKSDVMLGLGVSSISESHSIFHQNEKVLPKYAEHLAAGRLPTLRGHVLSAQDQRRRKQILAMMTQYQVETTPEDLQDLSPLLRELNEDGLVELTHSQVRVKKEGRPFLRNVCSAFDDYLRARPVEGQKFSKSI